MFPALLALAASPFDPATWLAIEANNAQILALPPDASRNFQISLAYQDIGVQFSALLHANATMNWATMAKWASNTVGMGIRDQFLPHWVDELLAGWPAWVRQAAEKDADLLDRLLEPLLNVTSVALSGGNRAVFVEIGGAFSAFGVAFANATAPDEARLAAYLARFTPDQAQLAQAMSLYYRATFEAENRTQLVFYANALVALEEQTRVQPYLETAFFANVTVKIFGRNVTLDFSPLFTRLLMSLVMPDELLWMRHDVPKRPWDGRDWAVGLDELTTPGAAEFYAQFCPPTRANTSVTDWVPLHQRMKYILALFRSRQDEPYNLCSPFTMAQETEIRAGGVPSEESLCLPYNVSACCEK